MTDNEIIKALECCTAGAGCRKCPADVGSAECIQILMKDSLDLIKRQQAEIEKKDKAFNELIELTRLWKEKYNKSTKAFIEGTELALDYGLPIPEEDLKKYKELVGGNNDFMDGSNNR